MKLSQHHFITSVFFTVLLLSGYAYYDCVSSVEYSLNKIIHSYQVHDTTQFLEHVDLNSLTSNYIDNQTDDTENIFGVIYDGDSKDEVQYLYEDKIMSWVKDGYSQDPIAKLFLNKYNEYLPKNRSKLIRVITPGQFTDTVTLKLMLYQPRYDTVISLDLSFKKSSMYWKLYDLPNLQESINLLKTLENKQRENLRKYNQKDIQSVISISNPQMTNMGNYDHINIVITNKSDKTLEDLNCQIYFYDKKEIDQLNLSIINESDFDDYNIIPFMIERNNINLGPNKSITESIDVNFSGGKFDDFGSANTLNASLLDPLMTIPDSSDIGLFIGDACLESSDGTVFSYKDELHPITFYGLNHFLL